MNYFLKSLTGIIGVVFLLSLSNRIQAQVTYGITAFGTETITASALRENYGHRLDELIRLKENSTAEFERQRTALEQELNTKNEFSYIKIHLFKSYSNKVDFIIDFVEHQDSAKRMAFRELNTKEYKDPDGLIEKWIDYAELSGNLFEAGEINDMSCPVVHCTWAFNHKELRPFLSYFESYVPKNSKVLEEVVVQSSSPQFREAAAYLLAHAKIDNQRLVKILEPTVTDPSSLVRNAGLRILYYAVKEDNTLQIPLDKVIQALDFPSFTDRNKALVILRSLPRSAFSKEQLKEFLPILLEILEKKDGHNYKNAHTVLKSISGEQFSETETHKWREWVNALIYE
jgi:hypothetical protein